MSNAEHKGPRTLVDILGDLFAARGFSRLKALKELENAWTGAVGEPASRQTQLGEVRRGILNVTVAHSSLLEELSAFQKPAILAALRTNAPSTVIHDIRFRVGPVNDPPIPTPTSSRATAASVPASAPSPTFSFLKPKTLPSDSLAEPKPKPKAKPSSGPGPFKAQSFWGDDDDL